MFVRRIYYDRSTEEILLCYMRQGAVQQGSVEEDLLRYPDLGERGETLGIMEWLTPDAALEAEFDAHNGVKIQNGQLVFYDVFEEEPTDPSYAELLEAYNILTGGDADE